MNGIEEEIKEVIQYKQRHENDDIYYKEIIKKKLIDNNKIIYSINNTDLDLDCPADFVGVNILPYYLIPDAQSKTANYICFETSFNEVPKYNDVMKVGQIIFYIICDNKNIYDKTYGIARHDLLSALIIDEFNWSNMFGTQVRLISNKPMALDYHYVGRTLIFEQTTPNTITRNKRVINTHPVRQ